MHPARHSRPLTDCWSRHRDFVRRQRHYQILPVPQAWGGGPFCCRKTVPLPETKVSGRMNLFDFTARCCASASKWVRPNRPACGRTLPSCWAQLGNFAIKRSRVQLRLNERYCMAKSRTATSRSQRPTGRRPVRPNPIGGVNEANWL